MYRAFILLLSIVCLFESVFGHSYVECADWRFSTNYTSRTKGQGWAENEGKCVGYARKWPAKRNLAFGHYDNVWPGYKVQGGNGGDTVQFNPNNDVPCYVQSRTNPITGSYAPNNDYGAMVVTSPGKKLCFKWSGRNHADNGETCDGAPSANGYSCPVYVNWAPTANVDPTQAVLSQNNVAILDFSDCSRQSGYNNADRPCGGCFTVPQRSPGIYTVQWRWALNQQGQWPETYATCMDIQVESSSVNNPDTPAENTPRTSRNVPRTSQDIPQTLDNQETSEQVQESPTEVVQPTYEPSIFVIDNRNVSDVTGGAGILGMFAAVAALLLIV
jgi:hypothetical protein